MAGQSRSLSLNILWSLKCRKSAAEPEISILYGCHTPDSLKTSAVFKKITKVTARIGLEKSLALYFVAHVILSCNTELQNKHLSGRISKLY